MAVKAAELESELIDTICARVHEQLPEREASACESFVRQYYHWVPPEDLADRSPADLYGAAMAHWKLGQKRAPGEAKVRVYNPDGERHGWQSPHTVVEIVSDDMPFIVDSVTMALGREGHGIDLVIHPVISVQRDDDGELESVLEHGASGDGAIVESILHIEVARERDDARLRELGENLERVLEEVRVAVEDWKPMRERTRELVKELGNGNAPVETEELDEVRAFLQWMADDHFTFIGYREYELVDEEGETGLRAVEPSGLGVLRRKPRRGFAKLTGAALELARAPHVLVLTKANSRATVHRPAYLDYVGVKRFDEDGQVIGECRFLGLYTSSAYHASPRDIPLLRGKVDRVMERAGFPPDSHDAKALLEIIESYPRDSLFQMDAEELFSLAMGILGLGERQRVRLFVRAEKLGRFVDCLVCIPRDRFNTESRERVGRLLLEAFEGSRLDWTLQLSESLLARVQFIIHCAAEMPAQVDVRELEAQLGKATRAWSDDLRDALIEEHGEEDGLRLCRRYEHAFPPGYRSDWAASAAVADIERLEELDDRHEPMLRLYRPGDAPEGDAPESEAPEGALRCKLFSSDGVSLSDVLPTFEHMGAKVVDERPYQVQRSEADPVWIYDFGLRVRAEDAERVRDVFQEAFLGVWRGELEDDGLNGLVLAVGLSGREITIVRAVAKYLRQAGIAFSDAYMVRTLVGHPDIARQLIELFNARFDPDEHDEKRAEEMVTQIKEAIDAVESLDEDRILRSFLTVIGAMLRTNYFRPQEDGGPRPCLSFKLDPEQIPILPQPRPRFEIFVYSPRVEGVHLRGGKVARGGLRWSDRPEDFRTEILGLMKAQMVKNALIVPVGSKGGFVVKRPPDGGDREALKEEAVACYRVFLGGLLDLTDNIEGKKTVAPDRVVRYDDDDPYLVVAADKGTASFSDIANEISKQYGFWLGDAFASGGSRGYDHKQMGITARGAWEAVKRHFRELGVDIQSTDFTAVGIGDMSGDVFGNGMLLSEHTKLIAAFNHMHVFIDPDPDPERSFKERKRLFEQSSSSWSDYDEKAISEGGGIYERTAKSIKLSKQACEALDIEDEELSPPELIKAILQAPVDLLWNGGIGTYVKASGETQADAGDKTNDAVRIDADELRCRVVGEGGNLGFTQRGRIEYALGEGRINTDAIDNVAGVNCSDHEVNIKILLDQQVAEGDLSEEQRNELLVEMTDAVADQVLYGSYTQTQAVSLARAQSGPMLDVHGRLIRHLEQTAGLDRELEYLPSEETINERSSAHEGLVTPELAVLMAYCKIHLYANLLESDLPEDDYLGHDLERYFPQPLPERYGEEMRRHRLRREIIATVVANQLVDRAGTTFTFRLIEETGTSPSNLARAYAVAREVFNMRSFWSDVEALDNQIEAQTQLAMLIDGRKLVERATRWLIRAGSGSIDVEMTIRYFADGAKLLNRSMPDALHGDDRDAFSARSSELRDQGVPDELANWVAGMPTLLSVFDIVEVAGATKRRDETVMATYFGLGARLELNWLRDRIIELSRANRWQALARAALRDDLYNLHRSLTQEVLETGGRDAEAEAAIEHWCERNSEGLERALTMLEDIKASRNYDTTTLPVALREIRNLVRGGPTAGGAPGAEAGTMAG